MRDDLKELAARVLALEALYVAVDELMCLLGAEGNITTRDPQVRKIMDALYDIDAGSRELT